jgi:hypothetical protein
MDPSVVAQQGAEGGFWVTAPPYRGYAKPLNRVKVNPHVHPVAALEKIASDLACVLQLCVPPVTLWDRPTAPTGEPRHHSVSAPPFLQVSRWGDIVSDQVVYAAVKPLATPAMSAMLAFDTWLECDDHTGNHPGNLLVTTDAGPPLRASFAFIDYSFSMSYKWRAGHTSGAVVPMYDPSLTADVHVVREAIDAIVGISDMSIQRTVGRVPDPYLSPGDKGLIIDGLRYRRDNLRRIIAGTYPGVL